MWGGPLRYTGEKSWGKFGGVRLEGLGFYVEAYDFESCEVEPHGSASGAAEEIGTTKFARFGHSIVARLL